MQLNRTWKPGKPNVGVRERCVSILIFNSEMNASRSRIKKNMNTPAKTGFFVIPILFGPGSLFEGVQTVEKIQRPFLASGNGNRIHPGSCRAIDTQWGND